jgi:hypothetical protein
MRNQLLVAEEKIRLLIPGGKMFQASGQQISCLEPKNVSNKETEQQTGITKRLCDHYTGLYIHINKIDEIVCLDPMYHTRLEASELKEQEDRNLDSQNELICRKCEHGISDRIRQDCASKFQRCRE